MATDPNDPRRREPGPDHPIVVTPFAGTVTVRLGDALVASSHRALAMREAGYPTVYYLPEADVEPGTTVESAKRTYCPFKGEATYRTVRAGGREAADAVWSYPDAYDAVAAIRGHVAFAADAVTIEVAGM